MADFKFSEGDFVSFIKDSLNKLEKNKYKRIFGCSKSVLSTEYRIIDNIDNLTNDNKIVWSKESEDFYRGIVLENCAFSDYRIYLERVYVPEADQYNDSYRVSFTKGVLVIEKIEYIAGVIDYCEKINALMDTIEQKLLQESN